MIFKILLVIITVFVSQALALEDLSDKIIIWDKDGTIIASKNHDDKNSNANEILPNVKQAMEASKINFVISGCELSLNKPKNFDAKVTINKFIKLMQQLPINVIAFSRKVGGVECYVIIKKGDEISVIKAHENPKYSLYIGKFKKPNIGMFKVISDIALSEFGIKTDSKNTVMIGDTWHDKSAAESFDIPFVQAELIHEK